MAPAEGAAAAIGESAGAPGLLALAEARRHLGLRESPPDSNRTPFGRWFGEDGVPWCAIFVSYCFKVGAGVVLCAGETGPNGCAYVPTLEAWLQASGQWLGNLPLRPGDIAIFNWDGGVPDHAGIVERSFAGGRFATIEGNTGIGNDANGGAVMRRVRRVSDADGFGRIQG